MNFTQLVCNSQSVWGKITPMKWAVFIKLYPMSKARMSLQNFTPDLQKIYTDISAVSVTLCNSDNEMALKSAANFKISREPRTGKALVLESSTNASLKCDSSAAAPLSPSCLRTGCMRKSLGTSGLVPGKWNSFIFLK